MYGWSDSCTAHFPSYLIFVQLFNSLWSFFWGSRCRRGGWLPWGDRMCHFQEQGSLLNPALYWACESWIFRSITKMFLNVGAAPNSDSALQFHIPRASVQGLVSDNWSLERGQVMCGGWGTDAGTAERGLLLDTQHTCSGAASGRSCALGLSEGRLQVTGPSDFLAFFIRWLGVAEA